MEKESKNWADTAFGKYAGIALIVFGALYGVSKIIDQLYYLVK